jgi:hypothetical protein
MPVRKYRSVEEMEELSWTEPGTPEHSRAIRTVIELVNFFSAHRRLPPGVFKFRSADEARAQREAWERSAE